MAKLAVLFFAAFAFQAAFAGVVSRTSYLNTGIDDFTYGGHYEGLYGQIQGVTTDLVGTFQGTYLNNQQIRFALREYVQNIEYIITKLQRVQGTFGNLEYDHVLEQVIFRLRQVLVPIMQITDVQVIENVDVLKTQLIKEFEIVAQELKHLVQYGSQYTYLIQDVLYDYLYAIQQIKYHIQGEYHEQGLYGLQNYGFDKHALLGKDYFMGKFYNYGNTGKGFAMQIQAVVTDLVQTLHTVHFDDVKLRQTFIYQIREYIQFLETIVEKLEQFQYDTTVDVKTVHYVVENMKHIVLTLRQFYGNDFTMPIEEMKFKFIMYIQNFGNELQKLVIGGYYGIHETVYTVVKDVLVQYLMATRKFQIQLRQYFGLYGGEYYGGKYFGLQGGHMFESHEQYTYEIEMLAKELSMLLQENTFTGQQVYQVLSYQARQFVQIIKNIIDQLEGQVHYKTTDVTVQHIIYRLHEVLLSFEKLAVYNTFTNVHELKAQFDTYFHILVEQIHKLVLITQQETQGDWYFIVKNVLSTFFYGAQDVYHQLRQVAQYQGQGYGFDQFYGKYDQGYGYGKYGKYYQGKYDQFYGKYDQGYGYGKYGKYYQGKYDQLYGKFDQIYGKYGQGYGYGKFDDKYGKLYQYGLQGLYKYGNKYDNEYEPFYGQHYGLEGKYGYGLEGKYGYGLEGKYGYGMKGQSMEKLVYQVRMLTKQVFEQFQTVGTTDKQMRQVYFMQARQLVQILNNMIDRFQSEVTIVKGNQYEIVHEVIDNLRQFEVELQRFINTGAITTVYQFRTQFFNILENIVAEFQKLVVVAEFDVHFAQIVKDVLFQYWGYLRNFYYQFQYQYQNQYYGQEMTADYPYNYYHYYPYNTFQGQDYTNYVTMKQHYLPLAMKYHGSIRGY